MKFFFHLLKFSSLKSSSWNLRFVFWPFSIGGKTLWWLLQSLGIYLIVFLLSTKAHASCQFILVTTPYLQPWRAHFTLCTIWLRFEQSANVAAIENHHHKSPTSPRSHVDWIFVDFESLTESLSRLLSLLLDVYTAMMMTSARLPLSRGQSEVDRITWASFFFFKVLRIIYAAWEVVFFWFVIRPFGWFEERKSCVWWMYIAFLILWYCIGYVERARARYSHRLVYSFWSCASHKTIGRGLRQRRLRLHCLLIHQHHHHETLLCHCEFLSWWLTVWQITIRLNVGASVSCWHAVDCSRIVSSWSGGELLNESLCGCGEKQDVWVENAK